MYSTQLHTKSILSLFAFLFILIGCSKEENKNDPPKLIPSNISAPTEGIFNEAVEVIMDTIVLDSLGFYFNDFQVLNRNKISSTQVTLQIPRGLDEVTSNFNIRYGAEESIIFNQEFTLRPPQINGVSESMVTFGDTLTFYGTNFDLTEYTQVRFNETFAEVIYSSKDSVVSIVPNNLYQQNLTVSIFAQLQEAQWQQPIQLLEPEITSTVSFVQIGEIIEIQGENFNLDPNLAEVILNGDLPVEITSVQSNQEISIQIPFGPFKDFEISSIEYQTAGMSTLYTNPIVITSAYILYTKEPGPSVEYPFSYNNQIYGFGKPANSNFEDPYTLWHLNTNTQLWEEYPNLSIPYGSITFHTSQNGILSVFLNNRSTDNFYQINLNNFSIQLLPDFPGTARQYPAVIGLNNRVIIGKGVASSSGVKLLDLFEFDQLNQTWSATNTYTSNFKYYGEIDFWNGSHYIMTHQYRPTTSGELSLRAIVKFNPSNNAFIKEYTICTSCAIEELLVFNNKFYSAYRNGLNMGFRNLDNNNDFINIPASLFYNGNFGFVTDGSDVYVWGQVINTPFQNNQGYWRINPNVF